MSDTTPAAPVPADQRPIGVFDSGLGGLTVLAELVRALPDERFIYFGDTARVPYGAKSRRIVQRYSLEVARHLLQYDIKLLVIACNTATAHAEDYLRAELASSNTALPVVGVVKPGVAALLRETRNNRVGVLGTRATVKSQAYRNEIQALDPQARVFSKACPLFVPLVEEGWFDKRITRLVIQEYLSALLREEVDTVVLGCTHYPLLKDTIRDEYPQLRLIDSSEEIAAHVRALVEREGLTANASPDDEQARVRIQLSDLSDQMNDLEKLLSGIPVAQIEEVNL